MLKPSLRTRYRYILFEVIGEKVEEPEKMVYKELINLVGKIGAAEMGIKVMSKNNKFFIKVERDYLNIVRGIIPLIKHLGNYKARPLILKTSGTIKKTVI